MTRRATAALIGAALVIALAAPVHAAPSKEAQRLERLERRMSQLSQLMLEVQALKRENSQVNTIMKTPIKRIVITIKIKAQAGQSFIVSRIGSFGETSIFSSGYWLENGSIVSHEGLMLCCCSARDVSSFESVEKLVLKLPPDPSAPER